MQIRQLVKQWFEDEIRGSLKAQTIDVGRSEIQGSLESGLRFQTMLAPLMREKLRNLLANVGESLSVQLL